ncbi:Uncharacterised protein [Lactiplantibacillus plantarum subsp. plantarum]|nr:hypothetical protein C1T23_00491 [Lactiplantibacillus plantarum]SPX69970.1 Uncharacterised protein [Lactiplantibacillus plantarum subsp. plantarum]KAE9507782.1 hypothetical protein FET70_01212 [Lactiplantibacillus plantarum]MCG0567232.1 hypothetical protein [Lactiplantibacillus plantarum]MCG0613567.1 hypothetical protein [Lactiplantibacillus plantarum]
MNKHNFSNKRSYAKAYRQCMREDILGQYAVATFWYLY